MKLFINNKKKVLVATVLFILIVTIYFFLNVFILIDDKESLYGTRLSGISKYSIDNKKLSKIASEFKKENALKNISFSLSGKIINFTFYFDSAVDSATSMVTASKILEKFSDAEKSFFEFQVFLVNENVQEFPKIGYKHISSNVFVWSN